MLEEFVRSSDLTGDMAWVAEVCGIETALKLMAECKGHSLYVPQCLPRQALLRMVRQAAAEGLSTREIARRCHCTHRYAQMLLTQVRNTPADETDQRQGELEVNLTDQ